MKELNGLDEFRGAIEGTKNGKPMVIEFGATWCGPCRKMVAILNGLEKEVDGVDFCKVDVGQNQDVAQEMMVESVPKIFLFKDGVMKSSFGVVAEDELKAAIEELK